MKTVYEILAAAKQLSLEEQRQLNSLLCDNMRYEQKVEAAKKSSEFNIGDEVIFDAKRKGIVKIRIDGYSRDRSCFKGTQVGGMRAGVQWTVATTLCHKA